MRHRRTTAQRALAVLLFLLLPVCLSARAKTDSIQLVNGNVINCEIQSMSRAYLSISTDSMSTLNVKWPDVARISSEYGYVVEDSGGRRYYGALNSEADRTLLIKTVTGAITIPMPSVITIYPSFQSLWKRFDGSVDAGYSHTKSSSRNQFNLNAALRYRSLRWESKLTLESMFTTSNGETETDRQLASLSLTRHLGARWHVFALGQYQHNLELDLSYRNSLLAGIARRIFQTDRNELTILAGAAYARENYAGSPATSNAEAGIGATYEFYKLYTPKIDISVSYLLNPSLTVSGRIRSELDISSRVELFKDFFWSLSFYDSYDSKPPGEQIQKNDYGVTTGIGWSFG